ncbi:helix-turn-helix domain-containing protein [Mycolicibacterium elephantis]|uniref:helix-turn-helix transcriptional regulator n=1 Tax=Mycolicibacterium elephantis TaxID=81858 RepID=UPI0007EA75FE|nr:helix-turn-helix domain-containing protein [Mycolicibacterium elephantis]OBE94616.1 transcriptional regulator [Mycolicibacterium elephantis]
MPLAERDTSVIAALADPLRRRLYLYVCAQADAVSRDQAAEAVAVPVHQAKFHLDKLEAEGLLESEYARIGGRRGPGAGRPSKLYRRAAGEVSVSLPDRDYELAGRLMADAIAEAAETGQPVVDTLYRLAAREGSTIGRKVAEEKGQPESPQAALRLAVETLAQHGYEPREDDARVLLVNCPFHRLAQAHRQLVCGMNHALISGLTAELKPHCPSADLEPANGRCCVVLTAGTR